MAITGPARTPDWRGWFSSFSLSRNTQKERENRRAYHTGWYEKLWVLWLLKALGKVEVQGPDGQTPPTWLDSCQGAGLLGSSCPWMKTCPQWLAHCWPRCQLFGSECLKTYRPYNEENPGWGSFTRWMGTTKKEMTAFTHSCLSLINTTFLIIKIYNFTAGKVQDSDIQKRAKS